MEPGTIWTIGHSNHDLSTFIRLLETAGIDVVADVRSQPASRFNPQFNRARLQEALGEVGIEYVYLGDELGGRPAAPELYDDEGRVRYDEMAGTDQFRAGVDRLRRGAATYRVAICCAEENPTNCHRRRLITPVLTDGGMAVIHLRGDGSAVTEDDLAAELDAATPPTLFADDP